MRCMKRPDNAIDRMTEGALVKQYTLDVAASQALARRIVGSGVPPLRLMKHAGEAVADRAFAGERGLIKGICNMCRVTVCAGRKSCYRERKYDFRPKVAILAGSGHKGGCGWFAAESLADASCEVTLITPCAPHDMTSEIAREDAARIAHRATSEPGFRLTILVNPSSAEVRHALFSADSIIDAIVDLGCEAKPAEFGPFEEWMRLCNEAREGGAYVVAADAPSGLDANTGEAQDPCVHADATVCMMVYKTGVKAAEADIVGNVQCDWIGVFPLDFMQDH